MNTDLKNGEAIPPAYPLGGAPNEPELQGSPAPASPKEKELEQQQPGQQTGEPG